MSLDGGETWKLTDLSYLNLRFRQIHADDFLVVSRIAAAISKRWVGPDYQPTAILVGGFEQVGSADLFITARSEPGDNQVSFLIEKKKPSAIFDKESVCPPKGAIGGCRLESFPEPLARIGFKTTQLAIAANAIDVILLQERGAHDGIEMCGVALASFVGSPNGGGAWVSGIQPQHHCTIIKASHEEQIAQVAWGSDRDT